MQRKTTNIQIQKAPWVVYQNLNICIRLLAFMERKPINMQIKIVLYPLTYFLHFPFIVIKVATLLAKHAWLSYAF